jgi:nucleolar protein 15
MPEAQKKGEKKFKRETKSALESPMLQKVSAGTPTLKTVPIKTKKGKADAVDPGTSAKAAQETQEKSKIEANKRKTPKIVQQGGVEKSDARHTNKKVAPVPSPNSPDQERKQTSKLALIKLSKPSKKIISKPTPRLPTPSPGPDGSSQGEEISGEDSDENDHLHGFSTDDDDSSDEENVLADKMPALDVNKLPTIARDDETVKRKLAKAKRQPAGDKGVCYIGRIPHGFYEDQLRAYFSQFGTVTRLRVSRNKKTGHSKHYGFIEFESSSVAQIVADTMNNYLLMGHLFQCKVIPKDEIHPELWVGANRKWKVVPRDRIARVQHNKPRTEEGKARVEKRLVKRQEDRKRKLAEAGIEYDFEAVAYKKRKPKNTT